MLRPAVARVPRLGVLLPLRRRQALPRPELEDVVSPRRFARVYREKRRDQAPHSPVVVRMARRHAAAIAWRQSRGLRK